METESRLAVVKEVDSLMPSEDVLKIYQRQADFMVQASLLPPGYKKGADLMVVGLRGREMGVGFWRAVYGMFPMTTPQGSRVGYMGTFARGMVSEKMPGAEIITDFSDTEKCVFKIRRPDWKEGRYEKVEVTWAEAQKCHWHEYWDKDAKAWKPKPTWTDRRNMLFWRCTTRTINYHFEDVMGGACYTADELSDSDPEYVAPPAEKPGNGAPYQTQAEVAKAEAAKPAAVVEVQFCACSHPDTGHEEPVETGGAVGKCLVEGCTCQGFAFPGDAHEGTSTGTEKPKAPEPTQEDPLAKFSKSVQGCNDRKSLTSIYNDFKEIYSKDGKLLTAAYKVYKQRQNAVKE